MIIGVPKEIKLQEHRIGLTPDSVRVLTGKGHEVLVQHNGGFEAGFGNESYKSAGAKIVKEAKEILKVDPKLQTERGRALIELLYLFEKNKAINLISAG